MELQFEIENIEDVPEGIRGAYTKTDDGKFRLNVSGVESESDVAGLRSALKKERSNAKKAEAELARYRSEVEELKAEREELLNAAGSDAERKRIRDSFDRKLESAKKDHERERDAIASRLSKRDSIIERLAADSKAESLAADLAVDESSRPILTKLIRERLQVKIDDDDDDPRVGVVILDREGQETDRKFDDLKSEFLEDAQYSRLVTDTRGGGGGGSRRSDGSRTGSRGDKDRKPANREERQASIRERYNLEE